jgi:predicted RNA-binding Zn ribbon-like protein
MATKQASGWKGGFLFLGNQLALDFLNTRPVHNGEPVELLAGLAALLRWFRAAGLLSARDVAHLQQRWGESRQAQRTMETVRQLREKLRKEVLAWERGVAVRRSTIDELNQIMEEHPMRARLKVMRSRLAKHLWVRARQPEDLFAPLADSAAALFAEIGRTRVRQCARCVLHFYDTSKKGTRRWCSMQLCGNRGKVAAYAARRRMP